MIIVNGNHELVQVPSNVEISAILSENVRVFVGSENAINDFKIRLDQLNVECRYAKTLHGFHSSFLNPIVNEFLINAINILNDSNIDQTNLHKKNVTKVISNMNGQFLSPKDVNAKYLCEHMLKPVRLDLSIETLLSDPDINHIIEIGPPGMLQNLIALKNDSLNVIHTMHSRYIKIILYIL